MFSPEGCYTAIIVSWSCVCQQTKRNNRGHVSSLCRHAEQMMTRVGCVEGEIELATSTLKPVA